MRERLDVRVVELGLAPTRTRAQALIMAGQVHVDGARIDKPGTPIPETAQVTLAVPDHPYVSRGGLKLAHALDAFGIDARGRTCLDIGASTGGFTDCLLQRGAAFVVAVDVGTHQLHEKLRDDARVRVLEQTDVRALTAAQLPTPPTLCTIDVSFIGLERILPALPPLLDSAGTDIVCLIKPQFEVGAKHIAKGGLVKDEQARAAAIERVLQAAQTLGFAVHGHVPSELPGAKSKNVEEFAWLTWRI